MTKEELKAKYPEMFSNVYCGFDSLPGWYPLIDFMCQGIVRANTEGKPLPTVAQVKEKFGGLRFYLDGANEEQYSIAMQGEHFSYMICESCGTTQNVSTEGGWLKTLCSNCREKDEDTST